MTTPALLRLPRVEAITGYKRSTIYKLVAEKKFPPPIPLSPCGGRASAWIEDEVIGWVHERIAAARQSSAA